MIDLVYPVGKSLWQHNELRYSLRSVEQYGRPEIFRVWFFGDPDLQLPLWLKKSDTGRVVHTVKQRTVNADQIHKLRALTHQDDPPSEFIWMNCDFILWSGSPMWLNHHDRIDAGGREGYHGKCFRNTLQFLRERFGILEPKDFELHLPMRMRTDHLGEMLPMLPHDDLCFRTIYGNLYAKDSLSIPDVKLPVGTLAHEVPSGLWCISLDSAIVNNTAFCGSLAARFPVLSRWERLG